MEAHKLIDTLITMNETMKKITLYHKGYEDALAQRIDTLEKRFNDQEKILKERELV